MKTLFKNSRQHSNKGCAAGKKISKKFSIVQKILLLALVVQLSTAGSLKAQLSPTIWNNFGAGSYPTSPLTISSTFYTDDTKAEVTAIGGSNPGPFTLTLSVSSSNWAASGSTSSTTTWTAPANSPSTLFSSGDRIMFIDMGFVNASSQNYDFGTVQSYSYSSGVGTLVVQSPYYNLASSNWHLTSGLHNAQVILIHEFNDITINSGGVITCDPWNGMIGGVVMLEAAGTLKFNWGGGAPPQITATGMGGPGGTGGVRDNTAVSPGTTGYGTAGLAYGGDGGNASIGTVTGPLITQNGDAMYNCSRVVITGGKAGSHSFFRGTRHNGTYTSFLPSLYNVGGPYALFIGNGGGGGQGGEDAEYGGWGGGGGGSGGANAGNPGSSTVPSAPTVGAYGGKGGDGAAGGGIVYIKAWIINNNTSSTILKLIVSDGNNANPVTGNGEAGYGSGGNGSNGGAGGDGADCAHGGPFPAGAGGKGGLGGSGASGGGGAAAGDAGTIWVIYGNSGSNNLSTTNMESNGGTQGFGGAAGGSAGTNGVDGAFGSVPNICSGCCPSAAYTSVYNNLDFVCDCDVAFGILGNMNTLTSNTYTNPSSFPNDEVIRYSSPSNYFAAIETTSVSGGCSTGSTVYTLHTHECAMDPFNSYFNNFITYYPATTTGTYTQWGSGGVDGYYLIGSNTLYSDNTPGSIVSQAAVCNTTGPGGGGGNGGTLGSSGLNGSNGNSKTPKTDDDTQTPVSYVFSPVTKTIDSRETDHLINLFPNPARDNITVKFYAENGGITPMDIVDMQGKDLLDVVVNVAKGQQSISMDVSFLAKGTYLFCVKHDDRVERAVFVRQ